MVNIQDLLTKATALKDKLDAIRPYRDPLRKILDKTAILKIRIILMRLKVIH